jgi:hypothetical protein
MKAELIKCEMCAFEHTTYDFFKADESDFYIIEYEFRLGGKKSNKKYSLMRKGLS